uniref:HIT-type domain-containing protein n=1 Tax=Caenorhabditis tropicalis TaxID=1561998 RepID=A0A1I7TWQ6_9PELO
MDSSSTSADTSIPSASDDRSSPSQCGICGIVKREPYKCPRCSLLYCTIKCYRSPKHAECSEKFYQEQVKQELSGKKADISHKGDDYKDKMQKFLDGDWTGIEEPEPLDSDDEDEEEMNKWQREEDEAIKKTIEATIDDYELDDGEIERRMMSVGLSDDMDELLNTLTPEEREAFKRLAAEMQHEELGFDQSCFK